MKFYLSYKQIPEYKKLPDSYRKKLNELMNKKQASVHLLWLFVILLIIFSFITSEILVRLDLNDTITSYGGPLSTFIWSMLIIMIYQPIKAKIYYPLVIEAYDEHRKECQQQ